MGRKADPRVLDAYWLVSQGNKTPSDACRKVGIARTSLYRYKPYQEWRKSNSPIKAR